MNTPVDSRLTTEQYWIDHCIGVARDAGNVDAAQDATKELESLRAELAKAHKTNDGLSAEYVKTRLNLQDAEFALTARDKALDAANKLWRLCVDEGWPWADGETQDALTELGLLVPRDMKAADAGEPCESCYGDCDTCYQAIDKLEDLK
jgi:hypothetical protein